MCPIRAASLTSGVCTPGCFRPAPQPLLQAHPQRPGLAASTAGSQTQLWGQRWCRGGGGASQTAGAQQQCNYRILLGQ